MMGVAYIIIGSQFVPLECAHTQSYAANGFQVTMKVPKVMVLPTVSTKTIIMIIWLYLLLELCSSL